MTDSSQLPKPGWYDDPDYANTKRFWDGERWTDDREPPLPGTPARSSKSGAIVANVVQLIIIFGFTVFVAVLLAAIVNG